MTKSREDLVRDFMIAFNQPTNLRLNQDTINTLMLGRKLIQEESKELFQAVDACHADLLNGFAAPLPDSVENLLKELADLQYVVSWFAASFSIPLDEVFMEVHGSNMSKLSPCPTCEERGYSVSVCQTCGGRGLVALKRPDGKVLKGPDYQEPDLSAFVKRLY